jgi:signal recognition particle subunit SRP19
MKDYDNVIIWLDYFNKNLSREKGRKVSKSLAVYDPLVSELINAVESIGHTVDNDQINDGARFPKRSHIKSGYIMIEKKGLTKNSLVKSISEKIVVNRAKSKGR